MAVNGSRHTCPNCGHEGMREFCHIPGVPVHSAVLLRDRQEALDFPRGDIALAHCGGCDFIGNVLFDDSLQHYGQDYEGSQSCSETYRLFHRELARQVVDRFGLRRREIVEIGCGQGEFLAMLCEMGDNRGAGFDPAFDPSRPNPSEDGRIRFVADDYSEKYSEGQADFICCKMTLEHLPCTAKFLSMVRRSIGERGGCGVFFMVPDTTRILDETAFWDVYYEHCSLFTETSLSHLFRSSGFEVTGIERVYAGQYLTVNAVSLPPGREAPPRPGDLSAKKVLHFAEDLERSLAKWKARLRAARGEGKRTLLWGGGSKAVAFVTALGLTDEIHSAVDINPRKRGTFLPGSGHQVIAPGDLGEVKPDLVVVMNPVYTEEVRGELNRRGLRPEVTAADAFTS